MTSDNDVDCDLAELLENLRAVRQVYSDPSQPTDRRRAGAIGAINSVILYLQNKPAVNQEGLILPFVTLVQALYDLEEGKQADFLRPNTEARPKQDQADQRTIKAAVAAGMDVLIPMCSVDEAAILVSNVVSGRSSTILQNASAKTIKDWRKNFRRNRRDKRAVETEGRDFFADFVKVLSVPGAARRNTRADLLMRLSAVLDDLAPKSR